jgi:hypothetical protein
LFSFVGGAGGSFGNMEVYFDEVIVTDNSGENQVGYIKYPLQVAGQNIKRLLKQAACYLSPDPASPAVLYHPIKI